MFTEIIKILKHLSVLLVLISQIAYAEQMVSDAPANSSDRINKLERDMDIIQKQFYRSTLARNKSAGIDVENADLESRMLILEEQLRDMNGRVEEVQFVTRQMQDKIDIMMNDMESRFQKIEKKAGNYDPEAAKDAELMPEGTPVRKNETIKDTSANSKITEPASNKTPDANRDIREDLNSTDIQGKTKHSKEKSLNEQLKDREEKTSNNNSSSSKDKIITKDLSGTSAAKDDAEDQKMDLYNKAIDHIKKSESAEAEKLLEQLIAKYPDDPLLSNVYYWLGEVFYTRKAYERAAIQYLKGYRNFPKGKKAADSMLKLAMSLSNLRKPQESCKTLDKLYDRFPDMSASIRGKADKEYKRAGCSR